MQFYRRYIEHVKSPASTEMLIGTRFHEFAEKFFKYTEEVPVEKLGGINPSPVPGP